MKAHVLNPLAVLGASMGYSRPLDRHDFRGDRIPGWAGKHMAEQGQLKRFANLTGMAGPMAMAVDTFSFTTDQKHPLGTLAVTKDGRIFRYASTGTVTLVPGNLQQGFAKLPNHLANTPPVVAIGATSFTYTPGNTAAAANQYSEGYLNVESTPGHGRCYRISGHAAITASTAFTLFLDPDDAIQVALTAGSAVGLHGNPYKLVIQCPTAITARVAGLAVSAMTDGVFGWLQTRGPASVLINGTPAITSPVANSGTTTGAVDVWTTAAAAVTITPVGYMMQVGVSTKNNLVFLTID